MLLPPARDPGSSVPVSSPRASHARSRACARTLRAWQVACNPDGELREHADVVEVAGLLDVRKWTKDCPRHARGDPDAGMLPMASRTASVTG